MGLVGFNRKRIKTEINYIGRFNADSIGLMYYTLAGANRFYSIFKDYYFQEEQWQRANSSSVSLSIAVLNLHEIMITALTTLREDANDQLGKLDDLYDRYASLVKQYDCSTTFDEPLARKYRILSSLYQHRKFKNTTDAMRKNIEEIKSTMRDNIKKTIERGDMIDDVLKKAQQLNQDASYFHQSARKLANQGGGKVVTRGCLFASLGLGSFFGGMGSVGVSAYLISQALLEKKVVNALSYSIAALALGPAGVIAILAGTSLICCAGKSTVDNCRKNRDGRAGYLPIP